MFPRHFLGYILPGQDPQDLVRREDVIREYIAEMAHRGLFDLAIETDPEGASDGLDLLDRNARLRPALVVGRLSELAHPRLRERIIADGIPVLCAAPEQRSPYPGALLTHMLQIYLKLSRHRLDGAAILTIGELMGQGIIGELPMAAELRHRRAPLPPGEAGWSAAALNRLVRRHPMLAAMLGTAREDRHGLELLAAARL